MMTKYLSLFNHQVQHIKKIAEELGAGFINKYSKSLSLELRNFIIQNLAFGPFVFRNPVTLEPIAIATDLQSLQQKLLTIPDNTLEYHATRNHFSKWLNARALFPCCPDVQIYQERGF